MTLKLFNSNVLNRRTLKLVPSEILIYYVYRILLVLFAFLIETVFNMIDLIVFSISFEFFLLLVEKYSLALTLHNLLFLLLAQ